jgi:replicative DNA helicase
LAAEVPTTVHVEYYAQAVATPAIRRCLIQAGGTIVALGYDEQPEPDVTLDQAEQTLFAVSQRQRGADFVPLSTVAQEYFDQAQQRDEARLSPTKLVNLDQRLGGGARRCLR